MVQIGVCVAALGIIPGNRRPSTGMAWLILVLAVPFFGLLAFLFVGSNRVERDRRERQVRVNAEIHARTQDIAELGEHRPDIPYVAGVAVLNRRLGALPMVGGNRARFYPDYGASIAAMTAAVETAERFVHVQFYISAWDEVTAPFFEALVRATERGVRVRLLFDHLGSRGIPVYGTMLERLRETTIEWHPMMPLELLKGKWRRPDLRNHRKILVVDGLIGFAGSQNLIEPSYNKPANQEAGRTWVELVTRVEGPVVAELNAVFLSDWYSETDEILADTVDSALARTGDGDVVAQVVPSGPGFTTENNLRMFTTLIYGAKRRLSITSPYFVPDESLLYAITTAAQRGVEVELFVSAVGDQFMVHHAQRSYCQALLEAGVRIQLYPAPFVLHSKHFSVDDDVVVIGSSNMDLRSFALNYEVSLMLLGGEVVQQVRVVEDTYRSLSRELTLEEWQERSHRSRYVDNVMRLTSALQ
ncbi:cardiolipin synthase [Nocardioides alpinus]|nr:cardiolipin synthase [Nocardioides alpinus]